MPPPALMAFCSPYPVRFTNEGKSHALLVPLMALGAPLPIAVKSPGLDHKGLYSMLLLAICWCRGKLVQSFFCMTADHRVRPLSEDEIDLREVFAALQRRWRWVLGGCLMGLALGVGAISLAPQLRARLLVQIPSCYRQTHQINSLPLGAVQKICDAERDSLRVRLNQLAKNFDGFDYKVDRLVFDARGRDKSNSHLVLSVFFSAEKLPEVSATLSQIQKLITQQAIADVKRMGVNSGFDSDWILLEHGAKVAQQRNLRFPALFLLGGLVTGVASGLMADRRSNRVYSQLELLRRLGYPLRLGLPARLWTSPAVQVLVGQLAIQLDQTLSWRVLSIARQHEAVAPLTEMLQQQGGSDLQCNSADPLLSAVLRFEPCDRPTGLLLVVEPGFNSSRALEEARLLISQMNSVHAVGLVLIGAPLPDELGLSVAG